MWSCGVRPIAVVLAGRIDCRSRQAACGPSRPRAKSSWITTTGLASSRESVGEVNERRKPDRGGKAARSVAGSHPINGDRASGPHESTCRGKALRSGEFAPFDEGTTEAGLAPRMLPVLPDGFGVRQGASEAVRHLRTRPTTPRRRGASREVRGSSFHRGEAGASRSKLLPRRQACHQPGLDHRKVVRPRQGEPGFGRGKNPASRMASAMRPEIERTVGARVVSRLQRSESSIFVATSRGAARQTETVQRSAARLLIRDGGADSRRANGCEVLSCERIVSAKVFTRP